MGAHERLRARTLRARFERLTRELALQDQAWAELRRAVSAQFSSDERASIPPDALEAVAERFDACGGEDFFTPSVPSPSSGRRA